jgi:hypothetical protein
MYEYDVPITMKTESFVRILAGSFVLPGTFLAWRVSPWWLLLPGFVGANLIQSALTGFCPPTLLLTKTGWVDRDGVIHWGGRPRMAP